MMLRLLTFSLVYGLAAAQVTVCPGGEVSCGEGQTCCFSNGRFTCCDLVDDPRIVPGSPSLAYINSSSETSAPARSTKASPWDYCPNTFGKKICCDPNHITCIAGSDCCYNSNCCFRGTRCCGNGQWCCTKPLKCGAYYMSCYSGAAGVYPVAGLVLAAIVTLLFNGKSINS